MYYSACGSARPWVPNAILRDDDASAATYATECLDNSDLDEKANVLGTCEDVDAEDLRSLSDGQLLDTVLSIFFCFLKT